MPVRCFSRDQVWLLPPTLGDLIPGDHPARFVEAFVDAMDRATWIEFGVDLDGERMGAPSYHPVAMLCVWLYGFMVGIRSSRKLEAACWDQLPFLWLTGWQCPDHNSLWRFYKEHRSAMRKLFKRTVKTAVRMGLVDLAVQAIDGTKVAANAAKDRGFDAKGLEELLERTEKAIAELEARNKEEEGEGGPARLPKELERAEALRKQVLAAQEKIKAEEIEKVNLTDPDTSLVKGRQGVVVGYNAQGVVSPLVAEVAGVTGMLITGAEVVNDPDDHAQAVPMLKEAEDNTEKKVGVSLLDGGYHSGENLEVCEKEGYKVLMPEAQVRELAKPYHKDHFWYDAHSDSYWCPWGHRLDFSGITRRKDRPEARVYRASGALCGGCPSFGECTTHRRQGRSIEIGPHEEALRRHRVVMATEEAKGIYKQRKELVEPVFGIMKEQQGARRFLLRGLANVRAEWALLAAAFNLRTLCRVWQKVLWPEKYALLGARSR